MLRRSHNFDKAVVALLLAVMAWPVTQVLNEQGIVPFLVIPLGLATISVLVVLVLRQSLEVLGFVLLWVCSVMLLLAGLRDLETGFPGDDGSFGISYAEQPVLFVLAMLANLGVVLAGAFVAIRAAWLKNAA